MNFNPINIILIIVCLIPIMSGILNGFDPEDVRYEFWDIEKDIMVLLSILLGVSIVSKTQIISKVLESLKNKFNLFSDLNGVTNKIIYFLLFFLFIYIIFKILMVITKLINNVTIEPLINGIGEITKKSGKFILGLFGGIFSIPTAIINVIILAFIIKGISLAPIPKGIQNNIINSSYYQKINKNLIEPVSNSNFVRDLPIVLRDSFQIKVVRVPESEEKRAPNSIKPRQKEIIYYNGVTLDYGIKSSNDINHTAKNITRGKTSDMSKAHAIYTWVGRNLTYDDNKARAIMRGNYKTDSGARAAFNTGKGICFDYSCLYVAMSRDLGLKVRLITGEGFNGREWVPHAWNQVYVDGNWINIDTTFYNAGNYFDSKNFNKDHKNATLAGEW